MGDRQRRLGAVNPCQFVGVDLNLWLIVYRADITLTRTYNESTNKYLTCVKLHTKALSNSNRLQTDRLDCMKLSTDSKTLNLVSTCCSFWSSAKRHRDFNDACAKVRTLKLDIMHQGNIRDSAVEIKLGYTENIVSYASSISLQVILTTNIIHN